MPNVKEASLQVMLKDVVITDSLMLQPIQESHAPDILRILEADPEIRQRVSMAAWIKNEADFMNEVATSQRAERVVRYSILEKQHCVGMVSIWADSGYFGHEAKANTYGFSYFTDVAARGRGIITSSLEALMWAAEESLVIDQFIAFSEDDNQASVHVLEKQGFVATDITYTEPKTGWTERKYVKAVHRG